MRLWDEDGQSLVFVALCMSIFLLGALGLGIDGAHLYAHRQMAQTAADAAAQAAIMSIFDGTNGAGSAGFTDTALSSFTCSTTDTRTPCAYARNNGFGGSASDTVTVDFPADASYPGVSYSSDPVNLARVTVSRTVNTTLIKFLGPSSTTVKAVGVAAIVSVVSPTPILVTHPTLSGALSLSGNSNTTICGGPSRSIEVNSSSATAVSAGGSSSIDLSHAGPLDSGTCTTGTGADFGVWGGPTASPSAITYGAVGKYVEPASPIQDPLASVSPPSVPAAAPAATALGYNTSGCPASSAVKKACMLYSPGLYTATLDGKNSTPVFKPGIYYLQGGGLTCSSNCSMYMATGFTDGSTGTNTGWTGNVLFYSTGTTSAPTHAGAFSLGANGNIYLTGSPTSSAYEGILFFQDRSSIAQSHSLGGGGDLELTGTLYLTNTLATMTSTPSQYQSVSLQGNSGSNTTITGEVIVSQLSLGGSSGITMDLNAAASYLVRQVALIN
jgi:Flp pilus assembly protein TadG